MDFNAKLITAVASSSLKEIRWNNYFLTFIFATWTSFLSLPLPYNQVHHFPFHQWAFFSPLSKSSKSLVNTARWEIIDIELKIHNIFEDEAVKGLLKIACSDLCLYTFEVIYLDHIGPCTAGNKSAQLSQSWVCSGLLGHISLLPPCYHISQCIFRSSENQLLQKTQPSQGTSFQLIFVFNWIIFKVNV